MKFGRRDLHHKILVKRQGTQLIFDLLGRVLINKDSISEGAISVSSIVYNRIQLLHSKMSLILIKD